MRRFFLGFCGKLCALCSAHSLDFDSCYYFSFCGQCFSLYICTINRATERDTTENKIIQTHQRTRSPFLCVCVCVCCRVCGRFICWPPAVPREREKCLSVVLFPLHISLFVSPFRIYFFDGVCGGGGCLHRRKCRMGEQSCTRGNICVFCLLLDKHDKKMNPCTNTQTHKQMVAAAAAAACGQMNTNAWP